MSEADSSTTTISPETGTCGARIVHIRRWGAPAGLGIERVGRGPFPVHEANAWAWDVFLDCGSQSWADLRLPSPPLRTKQLHGLRLYRLSVVLTAAAKALDGTANDGVALSCLDLATRIPTISGSPFPTLRSADPDSPETELHV